MKRWLCLILAAFLIVPVLPIGASAAEIYEFEYIERPMMYSDSLDFVYDGGSFYCPVIIPDGSYIVHFSYTSSTGEYVFLSSPVDFAFSFDPEYGCEVFSAVIPFSRNGVVGDFFCFIGRGDALDGSIFVIDFDMGSTMVSNSLSLERVADLSGSSDIGLFSFLESVKTGLIEYSTSNLVKIIVAALILACSPLLAWFGYRFIKRKLTKSVFKGRL